MSKYLKDKIKSKGLVQIMAGHSALSAVLAEEAGFDGVWASGFELSALHGLPDASLISMTQHLDVVRSIASRVNLPIVADIDTGFGNVVNVSHVIKEYERAGAAAVVIEDKCFPKTTSLLPGGRQDLLRIEEFQGKVEAACAAREADDFLIIARVEALIAGRSEKEAIERGLAYEEAGADMILIHSKQTTPDEIESFVNVWPGKTRLVIVPTAYPQLDFNRAKALKKIGMYIYGNHAIRAAVTSMQSIFARIIKEGGVRQVDSDIVSVKDIFRLQNMDDVKHLEETYLR